MDHWIENLTLSWPVWDGYRDLIAGLRPDKFPSPPDLNHLLPPGLSSHGGKPIKFVAADDIPGVSYEKHIFTTGQVSTRHESWHDLFNAMVWCRFPQLKTAMNAVHNNWQSGLDTPGRGTVRDALTLLDESGAVVVSADETKLRQVASHDWRQVFNTGFGRGQRQWVPENLTIFLCGHALLEKFLNPYKAITAHVLLVKIDRHSDNGSLEQVQTALDGALAHRLLKGEICSSPRHLSPLPLMGIPGWWPLGDQNDEFNDDPDVFRPARNHVPVAPIFSLEVDPGHGGFSKNATQ